MPAPLHRPKAAWQTRLAFTRLPSGNCQSETWTQLPLPHNEIAVKTFTSRQRLVIATLDNGATVHNENLLSLSDGVEAMGNDEQCLIVHEF